MWIEKLARGVLCVMTPLGPRYIQLSLSERLYLLWIFRHFQTLPPEVLSANQQQWLDLLCKKDRFIAAFPGGVLDFPVVGILERRPSIEPPASPRRPATGVAEVVTRFADGQQRS